MYALVYGVLRSAKTPGNLNLYKPFKPEAVITSCGSCTSLLDGNTESDADLLFWALNLQLPRYWYTRGQQDIPFSRRRYKLQSGSLVR